MREKTGYPSKDKTHLKGTKFIERNPIIPSFLTFSQLMDLMFLAQGDHYVADCLDLRVTSNELKKDSLIMAKTLIELGVKKDDIVCVAMPNYYQAIPVFKATNMFGGVTTYLNSNAEVDEIVHFLNMYDSKVFINFNKNKEYNDYIKKHTNVKHIITMDGDKINSRDFAMPIDYTVGNKDDLNFHEIAHVANYQKDKIKTNHGGKQDALILYTSGSTGKSKSLLFTNENLIASCIYLKNSTHLGNPTDGDRRWLSVVPFMYPYGFGCGVLQTMLGGREVILAPNLSEHNVSEFYKKQPDLILGSPAHLELTKRNLPADFKIENLKTYISGGDYLSVSQSHDAKEFFRNHGANVEICNSSGTGETLGCSTNAMGAPYRPETVGQLILGPDYVVLNPDTLEEVKYGETGVLCTSGKHVFKGYYGRDDLTDEIMITYNGKPYYMTGNIGYLDEDRYFTLIGRSSRFFIVNSLNKVYCELIQNVVASIDVVDSVAVVPKKDDDKIYTSKAYVVLKDGIEPSREVEEYIIKKCGETLIDSTGESITLKDYEIPTSVTFLDKLPRTVSAEKIDYEYLKRVAEEEYQAEKKLSLKLK